MFQRSKLNINDNICYACAPACYGTIMTSYWIESGVFPRHKNTVKTNPQSHTRLYTSSSGWSCTSSLPIYFSSQKEEKIKSRHEVVERCNPVLTNISQCLSLCCGAWSNIGRPAQLSLSYSYSITYVLYSTSKARVLTLLIAVWETYWLADRLLDWLTDWHVNGWTDGNGFSEDWCSTDCWRKWIVVCGFHAQDLLKTKVLLQQVE